MPSGEKTEGAKGARNEAADPDSASSQFDINVVDNKGLNRPMPDGHGYAVFGKVVKGMDVVDRMAAVKTGSRGPFQDVPLKAVVIRSVKLVK